MGNPFYNLFAIPASLNVAHEMLTKFHRFEYLIQIAGSENNGKKMKIFF